MAAVTASEVWPEGNEKLPPPESFSILASTSKGLIFLMEFLMVVEASPENAKQIRISAIGFLFDLSFFSS
jgi:hypothetical protein